MTAFSRSGEASVHDVSRVLTLLGATIALVMAVSIPSTYYYFSIGAARQSLRLETVHIARDIENIVVANPEMWEYEYVRLADIVVQPTFDGTLDERIILDRKGKVIVHSMERAASPSITATIPIFDSGRHIASVLGRRSVRKIVLGTSLMALLGGLIGGLAYVIFMYYPIRMLNKVFNDLIRAKNKFEATFRTIGEGIIAIDSNRRITNLNPEGERLVGWKLDEALGKPLEDVYCLSREDESLEGNPGDHAILRSRDGDEYCIVENQSQILDGERLSAEKLIVFADITARRKMEEQLRQSQKMEAVGRLAGGIAHDFNNLLTVITGYSELLLGQLGERSPQYKEVEEIKRAGDRARSLTQQLLAFSRKQLLQPQVLDLNKVVSLMENMLRRVIGEDVEFRTILGTDLERVKADPGQVEQVIANLVVNARDAMPDGGVLTIETANVGLGEESLRDHPSAVDVPHVCLSVSDTGMGMSADVKAHLFEPFFTTKEKGKGTGLGLSTVHGIINQSGGHVRLDSKVGVGTTIRIYLPQVEGEEAMKLPDVPDVDLYGRETVLLAEDEDIVRKIVARVLVEKGYQVFLASDGSEGLRLFEEHKESIDLLITDVVMPGMGGRELATRVKAAKPGLKVLYMSGYTDEAINPHGVLEEGLSFIQKPFAPDELLRKVREVLEKAGQVGDGEAGSR